MEESLNNNKNSNFEDFEEYLKMKNSSPVTINDVNEKRIEDISLEDIEFYKNVVKEQEDFNNIDMFLLFENTFKD